MSKFAVRGLAAAAVAGFAVTLAPGVASAQGLVHDHGVGKHRVFDLQAHRGGLAHRPESTLASFAYGLETGVSTLELDVQITKDGQAVVTYDRKIDGRKCVDTGPVTPDDPQFPYVGKFVNTLTLTAADIPLP
jgi:glycerophosphoryl diester phosphodiesterase